MPSDYISKSALMKAIENERQITVSNQCNFKDIINTIPTLDLVPVPVRCGECEYSLKRGDLIFCKAGMPSIYEDYYCANGKRKEQK